MELDNLNVLPIILINKSLTVENGYPIPNNEFKAEIDSTIINNYLDQIDGIFDGKVVLALTNNYDAGQQSNIEYEKYGVLAQLTMKAKMPNRVFKLRFNVLERVLITKIDTTSAIKLCEFEIRESISENQVEEMVIVKMIVHNFVVETYRKFFNNFESILKIVEQGVTTTKLADVLAFNIKLTDPNKMRYIEEVSTIKRLKFILEDLEKEQQILQIENRINAEVKRSIDESQKEYYLRERMKAIQNELGDKAKKEEDIEEFRRLIKEAKMPKQIEEKVRQELIRYQQTPTTMAESGIIKAYLDFILALPWNTQTVDNNDLDLVIEKLNENHYALEKVKERIVEYLAVKIMTGKNPQTILCLVGPPGVGKTSLANSIALSLGRKFVKQSLGGVKDESEIRGHRRTYIGALPGRILKSLKDAKTKNPVFLLDEIDKMASDYKGDPASAMLEVLDPEQNANFSDHYLEESFDLSQVFFITTANYLENIPAPLRDRMEIVEVSSYTEFEKFNIAKKHLLPKQLNLHGLSSEELQVEDEVIYELIKKYTREAGVREINRFIASLVRKSIKEILIKKVKNVHITLDNLKDYIGEPRFAHNLIRKKSQVGVVTGLAFTQYGGDTLDVEVTYYKGKGGLVLTGKLGDVMKESAQAALSYVKSNAEFLKIDNKLFEENDIHLHVPEGAVPKDGPSAGITIATAIVSALTNKKANNEIGMTGEINLRGSVLPIGGLKEKAIAAHRSGLKKILIPKENTRDIEEIPQEVKEKIEIIAVEDIKEVLKYTLK